MESKQMMGVAKLISETLEHIPRGVATARKDGAYQTHIFSKTGAKVNDNPSQNHLGQEAGLGH